MKKILSMLIAMVFAVGMVGNFPVTVRAATGSEPVVKEDNGATYITQYDINGNVLSKTLRLPSNVKLYVGSAGEIYFYNNNTRSKFENGITAFDVEDVVGEPTIYAKDGLLYNSSFIGFENVLMVCPRGRIGETTVADGTTLINNYAFEGCTSLTGVTIPDSVTAIGEYVFQDCTSLTSMRIGSGVTSIGMQAFSGCTSLTEITIPDSVTEIGIYAFTGCSSLTEIIIPDSVTSIDSYTFENCTSLTNITIPDGVISIGNYAFYGCTSLTSVNIPDSVIVTGYRVFEGCTSLTSVTIPNSVAHIWDDMFSGCTSLMSITIPDSVTSIEGGAFSGCTSLTDITIPDSVTVIGYRAFDGCDNLTIYGNTGSYAETFANENTIPFADISEMPTSPTEPTPEPTPEPTQIGDVNNDNDINISDLVILCKHVVGVVGAELTGTALANSDCDGDGNTKSDADDAVKLAQFLVKKIPLLPNAA
jgi:hypothetical protein